MAYCNACQRQFRTEAALSQHTRDSPQHKEVTRGHTVAVKHSQATPEVAQSHYDGEPKPAVLVVFNFACRHRRQALDVVSIMKRTKTSLSQEIVESISDAALRLLPLDNSPEGRRDRQLKEKEKKKRATQAEDAFTKHLRKRYHFIRENGIRKAALKSGEPPRATPDVVFAAPVIICSEQCSWIEYKSYFGFGKNPYVTASEKRQVRRYVESLGPGIIVYRLGFEQSHLKIDGVRVCREKEILEGLKF